jgi:hypothetical protein
LLLVEINTIGHEFALHGYAMMMQLMVGVFAFGNKIVMLIPLR